MSDRQKKPGKTRVEVLTAETGAAPFGYKVNPATWKTATRLNEADVDPATYFIKDDGPEVDPASFELDRIRGPLVINAVGVELDRLLEKVLVTVLPDLTDDQRDALCVAFADAGTAMNIRLSYVVTAAAKAGVSATSKVGGNAAGKEHRNRRIPWRTRALKEALALVAMNRAAGKPDMEPPEIASRIHEAAERDLHSYGIAVAQITRHLNGAIDRGELDIKKSPKGRRKKAS